MKQQQQLASLLDTVPDNVLIVSKIKERRAPQGLFANERINQFFGTKVVQDSALGSDKPKKKVPSPYVRAKKFKLWEAQPLKRKIFHEMDAPVAVQQGEFHDINELELRGVPGMFVASEQFVTAADSQSAALGFSAVSRVFTPHPIQDRTDDEMVAYADAAFDEIIAAVTGP